MHLKIYKIYKINIIDNHQRNIYSRMLIVLVVGMRALTHMCTLQLSQWYQFVLCTNTPRRQQLLSLRLLDYILFEIQRSGFQYYYLYGLQIVDLKCFNSRSFQRYPRTICIGCNLTIFYQDERLASSLLPATPQCLYTENLVFLYIGVYCYSLNLLFNVDFRINMAGGFYLSTKRVVFKVKISCIISLGLDSYSYSYLEIKAEEMYMEKWSFLCSCILLLYFVLCQFWTPPQESIYCKV